MTIVEDRPTVAASPLPSTAEHLTSPRTRDVIVVQNHLLAGARAYLDDQGFTELRLPVIGPVTDPGARGAKQVDVDYYGHRYKMMTSAILYKQAALTAFDRIFCIAPNVRLEPLETCNTNRHLAEFHQIDVEIGGAGRDDATQILEGLVKHMIGRVVERAGAELGRLDRDPESFVPLLHNAFGRMSHEQAVQSLRDGGHPQSPDAEIDWEGEAKLSRESAQPFFVTDYPKGSRGFYDLENPDQPGSLLNFDLLAPEGYGELCSGSQRENDYGRIISRMRETGENPAKYAWYLDLVRAGIPSSSGFGIGLERLTRYVAGLESTWQASAFPKIPGVATP